MRHLHHGWIVHQLDIKTTFLHDGDFHDEVYVSQPHGFVEKGQENKVCRLKKSLYSLRQARRAWHEKIHAYLVAHGFCKSPSENTLYVKRSCDYFLVIILYVDDMLLIRPDVD